MPPGNSASGAEYRQTILGDKNTDGNGEQSQASPTLSTAHRHTLTDNAYTPKESKGEGSTIYSVSWQKDTIKSHDCATLS